MMQSPPKHRHDGTSPLPLGMDWSPPPRNWNGRDTIWPHDPRTGWSYCITIPSWVVRPKSRDSDPIVFYRVQVGIQSPEGITTTRGVLRRFNDFLKLVTVLKRIFLKKNIPPAPPKGLLRIKSRALLEERRRSLEEWMMTMLLSDIDLSRSVPVASFLELEAAARSSFLEENQNAVESNTLENGSSSLSIFTGSTSLASENGSDTAYETSEIGTPSLGMDNSSEIGTDDLSLDEDFTSPIEKLVKYGMSNIDEGLFMGHAILEQLEGLPKHKPNSREINGVIGYNSNHAENGDKKMELFPEPKQGTVLGHVRKLSTESIGSDVSSFKDNGLTNLPFQSPDHPGTSETSREEKVHRNAESRTNEEQLVLPLDQRHKMNMVLTTMQRRLTTARTDMEDLISRLNQETAVKDYLATKVKDLEVELETTTQKNKENLQHAILLERDRVTQMQWDMEELRRKSYEMELKLKSKKVVVNLDTESSTVLEREESSVQQELDETKKKLETLLKQHQELQSRSKADIKVLGKEVKNLRNSQAELKRELVQSQKEKSEAERLLHLEKLLGQDANTAKQKLLHDCQILHKQLQACNTNYINKFGDKLVVHSSFLSEARDLLSTSDNQIDLLLSEVQLFSQGEGSVVSHDQDNKADVEIRAQNDELKNILKDFLLDNATLRKQVNSVLSYALKKLDDSPEKDDEGSSPIISVADTGIEG